MVSTMDVLFVFLKSTTNTTIAKINATTKIVVFMYSLNVTKIFLKSETTMTPPDTPWLDVDADTPRKPRFTDRWSSVHFLSGLVSMFLCLMIQDNVTQHNYSAFILGGLVIVHQGWEYYEEVYQGIPKWVGSKTNTIGDTLYFTIGALVACWLHDLTQVTIFTSP
jgi:hypothetical protein